MKIILIILNIFLITVLSLNAQVLDFSPQYGVNEYFLNQILFESIYKRNEELYKNLKIKKVYTDMYNSEYSIDKTGRTYSIKQYAVNKDSSLTNDNSLKNNIQDNLITIQRNKDRELLSYSASRLTFYSFTDGKPDPFSMHLITENSSGKIYDVKFYKKTPETIILKSYDNKNISDIIYIKNSGKDTISDHLVYDEKGRLIFYGGSEKYNANYYYSGDTLFITSYRSIRRELNIRDNKITKFTTILGNHIIRVASYLYDAQGLLEKIVTTYDDDSTSEIKFKYAFYED